MGQTQGGGHHVATHELEALLPAELSYDYFRDWLEASRPRVWSPELFHALKDPKAGHIRRDDFLKELDERTHVFLSHDMETDELGRDNYERMERVNAWLKSRGIVTWFRGDRRRPPALQQHFHAIDRCGLVVVFVTKAYCDKVQGLHGEIDQVRREYNACCHLKTYKFMVSVVQEPRCRDVWRWQGLSLPLFLFLVFAASVLHFPFPLISHLSSDTRTRGAGRGQPVQHQRRRRPQGV